MERDKELICNRLCWVESKDAFLFLAIISPIWLVAQILSNSLTVTSVVLIVFLLILPQVLILLRLKKGFFRPEYFEFFYTVRWWGKGKYILDWKTLIEYTFHKHTLRGGPYMVLKFNEYKRISFSCDKEEAEKLRDFFKENAFGKEMVID